MMIENNLPNDYEDIRLLGIIRSPDDINLVVLTCFIEGFYRMIMCLECVFVDAFIKGGDNFIFTATHVNVFDTLDDAWILEKWVDCEKVETE